MRAYNRCMADGEDSMAVTLRRRRFTLDEYHRMGKTGILGPDDRVELIEGEIIEMSPIGSRHAGTVARIQRLPEPPDVRLLIEVADSSLPYDRRTKFPLYARSGVTEAWLVDLDAGRLEIHRGAGYRDVRIPRTDETFSPSAFVDLPLTVRDLLG